MLNGFFLLAMAVVVIFLGARRLLNPADLDAGLMLVAAAGGIVTEVVALRVLFKGQKDNLNMKGAYWHVVQTFVGTPDQTRVRTSVLVGAMLGAG
jgi:cobalt-zinc-cadmium efflux system protein